MPEVATVPLTQPWFLGMANIRGNLYSVIDFADSWGTAPILPATSPGQARLLLFGPRVGDFKAGLVVERVLGLRNIAELAPASPPGEAPAWYGQRWMDADGAVWQEIDLALLAKDPNFLRVGT